MATPQRAVLVTGGNAGIGLALCTQLVLDHGCRVFLASRNPERGQIAAQSILPHADPSRLEVVQLDVTNDESVRRAAEFVKSRLDGPLFAVVNNAGTGLAHRGVSTSDIFNTNLKGPKRVCDAFIPLLHPTEGRVVNVGSGAGPMWLRNQPPQVKQLLSSPSVTYHQIEDLLNSMDFGSNSGLTGGYGASKACLHAWTMELARTHPGLISSSISPGYIKTALSGWGGKPVEEGTRSILHCLFADSAVVGNGWYWGSDAKRSPLTRTRDPGTREYRGEPEC